MNVASLDLCKELFELSKWWDTSHEFDVRKSGAYGVTPRISYAANKRTPAYDLSYLVGKILPAIPNIRFRLVKDKYIATAPNHYHFEGPTLEDVACKFAIELIKLRNLE